MAVTIASVKARQIFDSRGNPTVEVRGGMPKSIEEEIKAGLFCVRSARRCACGDVLKVFRLNLN